MHLFSLLSLSLTGRVSPRRAVSRGPWAVGRGSRNRSEGHSFCAVGSRIRLIIMVHFFFAFFSTSLAIFARSIKLARFQNSCAINRRSAIGLSINLLCSSMIAEHLCNFEVAVQCDEGCSRFVYQFAAAVGHWNQYVVQRKGGTSALT